MANNDSLDRKTKKKKIISFSALANFQCLGDKCEDTCCQHWDISFDKTHYNRLKANIISEGKDPTVLEKKFHLADETEEKNYANVIFNDAGNCPFLDSCGLCEIHANYGLDTLSDVCTFFPRTFANFDNHFEVSGSLSCPELARKILLGDEKFELKEISPASFPRDYDFPINSEFIFDESDTYLAKSQLVRDVLLTIMSNNSVSFDTKLYALSTLANAISSYYFSGCRYIDNELLEGELKSYSSSLKLTHTQILLDQYKPEDPIAIIVIQAVLRLRVQRFPNEKFSQLINASFSYYQNKLKHHSVLPDGNFPPEILMNVYQKEAKQINLQFSDLLDKVFGRYVQSCIFRESFTSMPNLFTYIHMLTIRVAMLKFLVASNPHIISMLGKELDKIAQGELLEKKLIEIIYQFSRSIDHNQSFLEIVYYAVSEQQMMHYDYSLPFIKVAS